MYGYVGTVGKPGIETNLYGYSGTVGKPGIETNLYGYSFNDPVNFIDPNGESATGYAMDMSLLWLDRILNGRSPAEFERMSNSVYTNQIIFDESSFRSLGGQCPINEPRGRTAPPNFNWPFPKKGYPKRSGGPTGGA